MPELLTWTNSDAIVTESGNYEATFTPTDTTDYNSSTCMVRVMANSGVAVRRCRVRAGGYGKKVSEEKLKNWVPIDLNIYAYCYENIHAV